MIWIKWILYVIYTQNARLRYHYGKLNGMHCISLKSDLLSSDLVFDKNRKPEREYLTRKEFFGDIETGSQEDFDNELKKLDAEVSRLEKKLQELKKEG